MSTHPLPASQVNGAPNVTTSFDPVYTKFLIRNDRSFATEYTELRLFGVQALGGDSNMAQGLVATQQQDLPMHNSRDECLNVDTYTWQECLQIIEEYEWPRSSSIPRKPAKVDDGTLLSKPFDNSPASLGELLPPAFPVLSTVHASDASGLPTDASERCDPHDIRDDHPISPDTLKDDVASESTMVASSKSTELNILESTTATAQLEDMFMEGTGPTAYDVSPTTTFKTTAEMSCGLIDPKHHYEHSSVQLAHEAEEPKHRRSDYSPGVTTGATVVEYPPTPAMSVSELQAVAKEIFSKSSPTKDCISPRTVRGDTESTMTTPPLLHEMRSNYCPPTVDDEHELDDGENSALPTTILTTSSLCAVDGQLILRPSQDWLQTYIVKEGVTKTQLVGHDEPALTKAEAAVAFSFVPSSTPSIASRFDNPRTPPASPVLKLQDGDLSSIMESLRIYSLSLANSTHEYRRSFSDTGIEIDTEEQPQSKRQRVHHDDPTANQTTPGEVSVFTKANGLEVVGGPPNEGTSDERDSDDTKPAADDTKASESVVEDSEGIHATKVTDDDAHIQTIMSKKADSFAIGEVSPNASAEGNIGISDSPSSRGNASEADSALPIVQLTGPYAESASAETQERITTASVSPTLSSVISPLAASTEHRCVRLTFKPLKPPKDPVELVKSEAADQVEDEDSAQEEYLVDAEVEYQEPEDVEESDELSEMDEEEMSRLSTAMETQEALDTTLPIKESTPAPETLASDEKEPNDSGTVTAMNDPASSQSENNATALILRHEVEFYYERRATRSETRTSDQGGAIISSLEGSTDTASAPAIKPEDDALLTKIIATREPGGRQTRSTTTSPSAPHHPAPASSADSTPNLPPADTRLSKPKTTPNPRCKTPRSHTTATETHKPTPKPDVTGADAKTTAPTDSSVLGKRKTRRSSALEEEVRKAAEAEGNIAKRLRSRDGV